MSLLIPPAITTIVLYQRFISPYKGFRCAHATLHQGDSCSQAVKKLIAQYGVWKSKALIKARFAECRAAFELLKHAKYAPVLSTREEEEERERHKQERGKCLKDCGCDVGGDLGWNMLGNFNPCSKPNSSGCLPDSCVPDVCSCG